MKEGYIKKEDRKNILLLTDDIRVHSGVAQIGREMIINTSHRYNWVQLAGSVKHPDKGKRLDISEDTNSKAGITDSSVILFPTDGYGNPDLLRGVIESENIDAIFLITDPRYFQWIFQMENQIRKEIPIAYLNIWDSLPAPMYNKEFYESCDALFGISKQTKNINEIVLGEKGKNKVIKYIPHGLNNEIFRPIDQNDKELKELKKYLSKGKDYNFTLLFNSRNIRRKSIADSILAWKLFLDELPEEKREKCNFILHTEPVSEHGTDLGAVVEFLFPEDDHNIVISNDKFTTEQMNLLYNSVDGVILISSAEGWGLALTESLLTATPFIANVTGGMQDQMRFENDKGEWIDFTPDFPSNHKGTYTKHGEWVLPVYPTNLSIVGSPQTPYIYDDRCSAEDAAKQILNLYNMGDEARKDIGKKGLEWALSDEAGLTAKKMSNRIIEGMDELFDTWEPREKFEFLKDTDFEKKVLKHKLIY
jgi:glycosyltransferase involved in cell wall biosynthesis|tara:strand:+ start:878 stop:2308 length:1431 start_codon:yes stop_codon:yes gene_type:complete